MVINLTVMGVWMPDGTQTPRRRLWVFPYRFRLMSSWSISSVVVMILELAW
jgi:hypothetical protein